MRTNNARIVQRIEMEHHFALLVLSHTHQHAYSARRLRFAHAALAFTVCSSLSRSCARLLLLLAHALRRLSRRRASFARRLQSVAQTASSSPSILAALAAAVAGAQLRGALFGARSTHAFVSVLSCESQAPTGEAMRGALAASLVSPAWRMLLLSDGSVTRHLQIVSGTLRRTLHTVSYARGFPRRSLSLVQPEHKRRSAAFQITRPALK